MISRFLFLSVLIYMASISLYAQNSCLGVVTDPVSKLGWESKNYSNYKMTYSYEEATEYCSKLTICERKWRIPTLKELQSLLDVDYIPTINPRLFPYAVADLYWSSTYPKESELFSYGLSFGSGKATSDHEGGRFYIRCITKETL